MTTINDGKRQSYRRLDDEDASRLFSLQKLNSKNFSHKQE